MPPRYAYWTIIAGGLPTAFRAADRDELMPTFQRLREKHPDAQMKWFARGKLWDSPEQVREQNERGRDRDDRGQGRTADWRPGGAHRDPRQKFKDAKKARNIDRRRTRFERKQGDAPIEKPHGDKVLRPPRQPERATRHSEHRGPRPEHRGPRPEYRGQRPEQRTQRPEQRNQRPEHRAQRPTSHGKPSGQRGDWRNREWPRDGRDREQPRDGRGFEQPRDWRDRGRPPREKPHGDPLLRPPHRDNRTQRERPGPHAKRNENVRSQGRRPFRPPGGFERNQRPDTPATQPPRPTQTDPDREPRPGEQQEPTPPPRPSEPAVLPPGPPERGRAGHERNRPGRRRG
jgi:hypothetical protein